MGEMSDYFNEDIEAYESLRDDYVSGDMSIHDAYDHGFLDETGCETAGMSAAWDRSTLHTFESAQEALLIAETQLSQPHWRGQGARTEGLRSPDVGLNDQAILNLYKPGPTCNWCSEAMHEREGKFGIFFWCKCPEQVTVSKKYWDSIKRRRTK